MSAPFHVYGLMLCSMLGVSPSPLNPLSTLSSYLKIPTKGQAYQT
ncbi:hypothetical protein SLEP1_g56832 [Rubroshorea leprosula]|uniref:Uncharacterized protein n=1 Tax=Rubroshorea leprosula TaxID=152421 RepID=A0AAV5MMM7_9ROSI|nr:hypothetical protein SLEP1_g56832 [Rubroshorea leprosula]